MSFPKPKSVVQKYENQKINHQWVQELIIANVPGKYIGKILFRPKGTVGPLQYHKKHESFHVIKGRALLYYVDEEGLLLSLSIYPGDSFYVPSGAPHRVDAPWEDSLMFEVSEPFLEDRVILFELKTTEGDNTDVQVS